jgi:hypothetical protein
MNARYDIPAQPPPPAHDGFVPIVKCTSLVEADRVVQELENAGISAHIDNKIGALTNLLTDLRNAYPFIRIWISSTDYGAARSLLLGVARLEPSA